MSAWAGPASDPPPLWDKQREAVEFARARYGSIVNYGMGCGKSRVAVELAQDPGPVVILTPKAVLTSGHWRREFARYSRRRVQVHELYKGTIAHRLAHARQVCGDHAVICLNWEALERKEVTDWIRSVHPLLVADEIHRAKAPRGKRSKGLARLHSHARKIVGLTGTLMPHSPLDAFGACRAVDPDLFGWSFVRFRARYAVMGGWQGKQVVAWQNQEELAERIARVAIRASREEMLDLPGAHHIVQPVTLSRDGMAAYRQMERAMIVETHEGILTAANGLTKLLRLQQITSGTASSTIGDERPMHIDDTKRLALRELIEDTDEPIVVFGRFRADLDSARWAARKAGATCSELSGRAQELAAWQAGETRVLAVQIAAGSEGVDLTRSAIAVFCSIGFSLGQYEQALARLDRPGQTRPVTYYHLVARGTVDERVYAAVEAKRDVISDIIEHWKELECKA